MTDQQPEAEGAPHGVLGKIETRDLGVISENLDEINLQPAAYDLRVGHIITAEEYLHLDGELGRDVRGRRKDAVLLHPGQTATLASHEKVSLPLNVNGIIVPRDSYAKRGLLTLNAGHIDPSHKGFVTAQVINLTDRPFLLQLKESYFSLICFFLARETEPRLIPLDSDEQRIRNLRTMAAQAPVSLIQKETLEKVFVSYNDLSFALLRRVGPFVVGLAALGGLGVGIWQAVEALS